METCNASAAKNDSTGNDRASVPLSEISGGRYVCRGTLDVRTPTSVEKIYVANARRRTPARVLRTYNFVRSTVRITLLGVRSRSFVVAANQPSRTVFARRNESIWWYESFDGTETVSMLSAPRGRHSTSPVRYIVAERFSQIDWGREGEEM